MLSFLVKKAPRTTSSHLNKILLDGGRSIAEFKPPTDRYLVINRLPPSATSEPHRRGLHPHHPGVNSSSSSSSFSTSSLAPPLHQHFWQDETFHIIYGKAEFTIGKDRTKRLASAGEVVIIPRRVVHTFRNASEDSELVIEFVLDPASKGTDEAYFRNVWGYRNDCTNSGRQRSLFQSLLFMHRGGVIMALPGPEPLSIFLGLLLNYIGGVLLGRIVLGYQDSYPEYYHESSQ